MKQPVRFTLNGREVEPTIDPERKLLWVLRHDLAQTGTKYGCGEGDCGSCTVLLNGVAVRSCQVAVKKVAGKEVTTIEGLARDGKFHPLQQAFVEEGAAQCGFCTPGMILEAADLLRRKPDPTRDEVIRALDRNLCRCGAHVRILRAVESAAGLTRGEGR